ncbi:hypothetical protein K439DRAFT_313458 [Ramaria rubella]|nr:hypothetical protein K439DRAFT_313458 [Ramaria rubella]
MSGMRQIVRTSRYRSTRVPSLLRHYLLPSPSCCALHLYICSRSSMLAAFSYTYRFSDPSIVREQCPRTDGSLTTLAKAISHNAAHNRFEFSRLHLALQDSTPSGPPFRSSGYFPWACKEDTVPTVSLTLSVLFTASYRLFCEHLSMSWGGFRKTLCSFSTMMEGTFQVCVHLRSWGAMSVLVMMW